MIWKTKIGIFCDHFSLSLFSNYLFICNSVFIGNSVVGSHLYVISYHVSMQCMKGTILFYQFCSSTASTVSKWMDISSWSGRVIILVFWAILTLQNPRGTPSGEVLNVPEWKNCAIIALYLENGARYAHTYDGTLIGSCRWPIDPRSNDLVWPWRVGCQGSAFLDDLDFAPNDLERPNSARCHRWVRECFYGIRHAPNPKEVGAQCPKIFWDPYWYLYGFELVRAFHIWHDNTCGGGAFLWGQIHPFLRQQDLGAHKIFGIPYWCPYSLTYSDGTWHGKTSGGLLWFSQVPYPKGMGNGVGTNFGVGRRRGEARRAESGGGGSWGGDRQPLPTN